VSLVVLPTFASAPEAPISGATLLVAYIGPGVGLMSIVVFLAVLVSLVVGTVGFLWYPLRRLFGFGRHRPASRDDQDLFEE